MNNQVYSVVDGEIKAIDLHAHTILSQEEHCDATPQDLLSDIQAIAKKLGGKVVFSITDHGSILGSVEAQKELKAHPELYPDVIFINGAEYNTSLKSLEKVNGNSTFSKCHLLAYDYDENEPEILTHSQLYSMTRRNGKTNTGHQLIASINEIEKVYGVQFKYEMFKSCLDKRKHIDVRREFIRIAKEYLMIDCMKDVTNFENVIKETFYTSEKFNHEAVGWSKLDIVRNIELIHNAGGKAVIAHPNSIKYQKKNQFGKAQKEMLTKFVKLVQQKTGGKLYGMEAFHSMNCHGKALGNIIEVCEENNLYITGGSDHHGPNLHKQAKLTKIFPKEFDQCLYTNDVKLINSDIPNRLTSLAFVDHILGINLDRERYAFTVNNVAFGEVTKQQCIDTARKVGETEKAKKQKGKTKGLEEDAVNNIYRNGKIKGKEKRMLDESQEKPMENTPKYSKKKNLHGVKHKPKKHKNKSQVRHESQDYYEIYKEELKQIEEQNQNISAQQEPDFVVPNNGDEMTM